METDADVEALEKELELFKSDAARQLDELVALTQAADACIADSKRETHEARCRLRLRFALAAARCRCAARLTHDQGSRRCVPWPCLQRPCCAQLR